MTKQQASALELANEARKARADIKARLRSGELDARDILLAEEVPAVLERVQIAEFLSWLPRFGPSRVQRILRGSADPRMIVNAMIPLGRLSPRTRRRIARVLPEPATAARRAA